MEKCKCYHTQMRYHFDTNVEEPVGYCYGTKECEECSCGGDKLKCNFYDYVRKQAREEFDKEIQEALEKFKSAPVTLMPVEDSYLSRQEILDLVVDGARTLNKKVPEEFLERLFK